MRRESLGFHRRNTMHDAHQKTAEHQELAAQAHRSAAEHNEKGDNKTGNWHADRALDYSYQAYRLAKEAHTKSGQIRTL
jgi:transposase InsO family protein